AAEGDRDNAALAGGEGDFLEPAQLLHGGSRVVTVTLGRDALAFVGTDLQWVVEPGDFKVMVGDQEATFTVR
ncbi:MAG: fibronectin type III-like domain-contianing protein, partial [Bacteroidota bacterium]